MEDLSLHVVNQPTECFQCCLVWPKGRQESFSNWDRAFICLKQDAQSFGVLSTTCRYLNAALTFSSHPHQSEKSLSSPTEITIWWCYLFYIDRIESLCLIPFVCPVVVFQIPMQAHLTSYSYRGQRGEGGLLAWSFHRIKWTIRRSIKTGGSRLSIPN